MSQGLEDITVIGSALNVVNVNVSVSLMGPYSAVQVFAIFPDLRPTATAVQQISVTRRSATGMNCKLYATSAFCWSLSLCGQSLVSYCLQLSQLQLLDVSHNKVKSLKPLSSLTGESKPLAYLSSLWQQH